MFAVIVVLGVGMGALSWWLNSVTTPTAVAVDFMSALSSGDASRASGDSWMVLGRTHHIYRVSGFGAFGPQHFTGVHVISSAVSGMTAAVTLSYRTSAGSAPSAALPEPLPGAPSAERRVKLRLTRDRSGSRFLFFPMWRVVLAPVVLKVTGPTDHEALTIDGRPEGRLGPGGRTIPLLPGRHSVATSGSALWSPGKAQVTVRLHQHGVVHMWLRPQIAAGAAASARRVIAAAFRNCTTANPTFQDCPQNSALQGSLFPPCPSGCSNWRMLGDPLRYLRIVPHPPGAPTSAASYNTDGYGIFDMEGADGSTDPKHPALYLSAGIYDAELQWSGLRFTVVDLISSPNNANPAGVAATQPADVTVPGILNTIRSAFALCAASTSQSPPNCPQNQDGASLNSLSCDYNAPIRWTIKGNPVAPKATQVLFDSATNSYQVTGSWAMSYSCSSGGQRSGGSISDNWEAEVFWNRSHALVDNIADVPAASSSKT